MPRHAEAMPMPEPQEEQETELKEADLQEIEDLTEEANEAPKKPEIEDLTHETEEAKDDARWNKMYKEIAPDMTEQAHEVDPKDEARWNKMYKEIAPDMTAEVHEVDPADEARYKAARAELDAIPDHREVMPQSPPPIPKAEKKPSIWKRLFGRKG
jgi:hypothetical protein